MTDRRKDFERFGTCRYVADIHFYDFPARIQVDNAKLTVTSSTNPIRVAPEVINYPDLERWENEMYNGLFDSMEGTDWDKVIAIEM